MLNVISRMYFVAALFSFRRLNNLDAILVAGPREQISPQGPCAKTKIHQNAQEIVYMNKSEKRSYAVASLASIK